MEIQDIIAGATAGEVSALYDLQIDKQDVQLQKTRDEFEGDLTVVVFPFLRGSKKSPEATAEEIGISLTKNIDFITNYNVVKGFLNLSIADTYWLQALKSEIKKDSIGQISLENPKTLMVEYSSPNTNKPLHLGHLRNNYLGYSVAEILKANGNKVIKTQIINDRGIHICKSMLSWMKWGNGATPESTGIKGDRFVGDYYVMFEKAYKAEQKELIDGGMDKDEAKVKAPLFLEAQEMLRNWEDGDSETMELWKTMNQWVYDGFEVSYKLMGVDFDKLYYESETYLLGKKVVDEGLEKGVFYRRDDGSVWCDLTEDGLDEKLVLRSDGTAVYMTQDIGTAIERYNDFKIDGAIYTVGNEQDYHFKVLFLILKKLGYDFWKGLYHLSYGMIGLPDGRMKTREGNVVDADDLIQEMIDTAKASTLEKGKLEGLSYEEKNGVVRKIALCAIKYFMLKIDPKKGMTFDPNESIDFNGNTGPFIIFNYVRTQSVLRKAKEEKIEFSTYSIDALDEKEISLIKLASDFESILKEAGNQYSPALICNYCYDLAKEYSQFWASHQIIKLDDEDRKKFRIELSVHVGNVLKKAMLLLGIDMPERM